MYKQSTSRCQIIRAGILERVEMDTAIMRVGGKSIRIPKGKVDVAVEIGDVAVWDGERWMKKH